MTTGFYVADGNLKRDLLTNILSLDRFVFHITLTPLM